MLLICIYELDITKYLADKILISNKLFPWTQTYQISAKKKKKKSGETSMFPNAEYCDLPGELTSKVCPEPSQSLRSVNPLHVGSEAQERLN